MHAWLTCTYYTTRRTWQPWRQIAKRGSELKQRFYSCMLPLQLGMAICAQYESAYFPASCVDNQLPLRPEAESRLWFCGLQTQQLTLVVGCPTFAIWPQNYSRNNLRRLNIKKIFWGAMPPDSPSRRATCAIIAYRKPPFQDSRSATVEVQGEQKQPCFFVGKIASSSSSSILTLFLTDITMFSLMCFSSFPEKTMLLHQHRYCILSNLTMKSGAVLCARNMLGWRMLKKNSDIPTLTFWPWDPWYETPSPVPRFYHQMSRRSS